MTGGNNIGKSLFELIQVAIGQRSCMSRALTMEEWKGLYGLLKKHALLGVGYVAIQKLPKEQWPPNAMIMQWVGVAQKIRLLNLELNEECRKVVTQLELDGIGAVVIKGQSNLENYPEELREYRNPGDIDLWTKQTNDCGIPIAVKQGEFVEYEYYKGVRGIIEYARLQRMTREDKSPFKPLYYHVEYHTDKGTEVEMHYRPSFLCSPIRNMRMQRWFKEQFDVCLKNRCQLGFPVITSSVNVVYQLVHLHRHVFEGGVGLRQLMDYYFALKVWHNDVMECKDLQTQGMWSEGLGTPVMSKEEVMAVIRSFGMGKFAGAVMFVINEVFGGANENEKGQRRTRRETDGCPQADFVGECESSEFKQNLNGGPQADGVGKQVSINDERLMIKDDVHTENTEGNGCPQADDGEERELKRINRELKENNFAPWMICEPNEKEGRKLLEEIMKGGNFGQYDTRDAALKKGGMMKHGVWKLKRVMRLVSSYPEEALWEPVFRVYHLMWRTIHN